MVYTFWLVDRANSSICQSHSQSPLKTPRAAPPCKAIGEEALQEGTATAINRALDNNLPYRDWLVDGGFKFLRLLLLITRNTFGRVDLVSLAEGPSAVAVSDCGLWALPAPGLSGQLGKISNDFVIRFTSPVLISSATREATVIYHVYK